MTSGLSFATLLTRVIVPTLITGPWLAWGCARDETPVAAEPAPAPTEVAAAAAAASFHTRYGLPGPWSREGGTRDDFDRDAGTCLERSKQTRRAAAGGDPHEAAYRGFRDCMDERAWTRDAVAKPGPEPGADEAAETPSD